MENGKSSTQTAMPYHFCANHRSTTGMRKKANWASLWGLSQHPRGKNKAIETAILFKKRVTFTAHSFSGGIRWAKMAATASFPSSPLTEEDKKLGTSRACAPVHKQQQQSW